VTVLLWSNLYILYVCVVCLVCSATDNIFSSFGLSNSWERLISYGQAPHPFQAFPRYHRTMTFILTHTLLTALRSRRRVPIPTSCFLFTEQSTRTCYHRPWCWLCRDCWIVSWSWTRALVSHLGWHVYPNSFVGEFYLDIQKRRINFFFLSFSRPGTTWQHEQGSQLMLDHMIAEYEISITAKDQSFIKALIAGDPSKCRSVENYFLNFEISNCALWMEMDI